MGGRWRKKASFGIVSLILGMLLVLAGCGSGSSNMAGDAAYSGTAMADSSRNEGAASIALTSGEHFESDMGSDDGQASSPDHEAENTQGLGGGEENLGINRKLIYRAEVSLEVEDFAAAQSEIRHQIQMSGGYLLEFNESRTDYERGGMFVIKVPSNGFMSFLSRLEALSPDHYRSRVTGEDVTEEYVDLAARLKAQEVTEQRLLSFMEQATRADDLVAFSQELVSVQERIEQIKGRMRYLEQNVAYSTIEVDVYERGERVSRLQHENAPFGERLAHSLRFVLNGISVVLQELVIFIISALPVVIVLGVIASPFYLWYRRSKRQRQEEETEWRFGGEVKTMPLETTGAESSNEEAGTNRNAGDDGRNKVVDQDGVSKEGRNKVVDQDDVSKEDANIDETDAGDGNQDNSDDANSDTGTGKRE